MKQQQNNRPTYAVKDFGLTGSRIGLLNRSPQPTVSRT